MLITEPRPYSTNLDYYQLSREFICNLRGDISQRQLSQQLGYTFNKVGKWESGVTQIKWNDFLQIAETLSYPINEYLQKFFGNYSGLFGAEEILRCLEVFFGLQSIKNKKIQRQLKKWQERKPSPDLAEIFEILDSRPAMLVGFLSLYTDCSAIESIEQQYQVFQRELSILSEDPNVGYVNEALKLRDYQELEAHDEELLACHAGCSVEQLRQTLKRQVQTGNVLYDGKKYHPSIFEFSFSTLNNPKVRIFNKYTFELIAKKYPLETDHCLRDKAYNTSVTSSRVVALSKDASIKIDRLVSKFHNEVGEIVKNDHDTKDNVQIISLASMATALRIENKK